MKVWELMQRLSELPAGADVYVTAYPGGTLNSASALRYEGDDEVKIEGDGQYDDDLQLARKSAA